MQESMEGPSEPSPLSPTEKPKRVRVLWKWSAILTVLVLGYFMWECGSGLVVASKLSDTATKHFHAQLDAEDFQGILNEADERFQSSGSKDSTLQFFAGVHKKLGKTVSAERGSINVNANTSGTFITVTYESAFENGRAEETFTWRKTLSGSLKLVGYNIQSNVFITQ